jgi:hypothetical protein
MAYSHLPYPTSSSSAAQSLNTITSDTVFYVATTGDDGTGDGTLAKPYLTLAKALQVANTYTIVGTATLYIRLLRGEYTISTPVNLYHPQGSNIVIEGDPAAFNQRTLYQVQNYTWNIQNFAGGGHTGSIRLFDGVTTNTANTTKHGFTSPDQGMYFTITNAAIGSRDGYQTSSSASGFGINSNTTSDGSYTTQFYGDRFFNHGCSFEEGEGILGIGRILGATTSDSLLAVQFQNTNTDVRCPSLDVAGGLNNVSTWAGVGSNYPESQYSQPNGYYGGDNTWTSDFSTVTLYPTKASTSATVTVTTDPYVLSTYPVTIRAAYGSNYGTLFLKNGTLKGIRNIFFINNAAPYTLYNGTTGSTANYSQALSAITNQNIAPTSNGTALLLENSSVGIRHLGFLGTGTALSAYGSKVYAYYDNTGFTMGTPSASQSGQSSYAVQNTLDNAPVICTAQCKHGIVAKNSVIDFTNGSGLNRNYGADYRHNGSYISSTARSVELFNSKFTANSVHVRCDSDLPKFKMDIVVPVFTGMGDKTNAKASFPAYQDTTEFSNVYPAAKLSWINTTGTAFDIGYVNYVVAGGIVPGGIGTTLFGSTSGASLITGSDATEYRYYTLYGVKVTTFPLVSLKTVSREDLNFQLDGGTTFSIKFYKDSALSGVSAQYFVGNTSVLVSGRDGVTTGYTNVISGKAYINNFVSFGGNDASVYMNSAANAVAVYDGSQLEIEKCLSVVNGGYRAVDVRNGSTVIVGDLQTSSSANSANPAYDPTPNPVVGSLCVRGYSKSALHLSNNSRGHVGAIFAKNNLHGDPAQVNSTSTEVETVSVNSLSSLDLGRAYIVGVPGRTINADTAPGVFTSWANTAYGLHTSDSYSQGMIYARNRSSITIYDSTESVFAFDGASADMRTPDLLNPIFRRASVTNSYDDSTISLTSAGALQTTSSDDWTDSAASYRIVLDQRATQRLVTRNGDTFLYNNSGAVRAWQGKFPTFVGDGFTTCGMNIGNADGSEPSENSGGGVGVPGPGITWSSYVENFGKVIRFR